VTRRVSAVSSDADPEDSINYEGGVRYTGRYASGLAIGFYNDYDNLLAICRQGTGCPPEDIDNLGDNEYIVSRRPFGARPGLPFQVIGGFKYSLGG
jgi:Fe(3+) dicitrate transport protein